MRRLAALLILAASFAVVTPAHAAVTCPDGMILVGSTSRDFATGSWHGIGILGHGDEHQGYWTMVGDHQPLVSWLETRAGTDGRYTATTTYATPVAKGTWSTADFPGDPHVTSLVACGLPASSESPTPTPTPSETATPSASPTPSGSTSPPTTPSPSQSPAPSASPQITAPPSGGVETGGGSGSHNAGFMVVLFGSLAVLAAGAAVRKR